MNVSDLTRGHSYLTAEGWGVSVTILSKERTVNKTFFILAFRWLDDKGWRNTIWKADAFLAPAHFRNKYFEMHGLVAAQC